YRRGIASLSVVKELFFRVDRNALNASGPVWRDLPVRMPRTCLPALPQFHWDFAWCLSCLATCCRNPLRNFFPLVTAPNHGRKIKNPASSAGCNHSHLSGSTRCSTSFYPVLVKNPTIRIYFSPLFFLGLEEFSIRL